MKIGSEIDFLDPAWNSYITTKKANNIDKAGGGKRDYLDEGNG